MLAPYIETDTPASRVLYVNSKDGQTIYNDNRSNFEFTLEEPIVVPPHHTILASVISAEIPYSFYNFRDDVNTLLDYQITAYGTPASYGAPVLDKFNIGVALTIRQGNYNAVELANLLTTAITELQVTYDHNSLKYNFLPLTAGFRVTLGLRNGQSTGTPELPGNDMNEELGFDWFNMTGDPYVELNGAGALWGTGYTNPNPGVVGVGLDTPSPGSPFGAATVLVADDVADLTNSIRSLFIRSNLSTTSILDSHIGGGFSNILCRVPINVQSGGVINIKPSDGNVHKLLIKQKAITSIALRLTNQKNTDITLNGLDYDVSIKLEFIETKKLNPEPLSIRQHLTIASQNQEEVLAEAQAQSKPKTKPKTKKRKSSQKKK